MQLPATITTLFSYYFFGLPLAIYLGFQRGLNIRGMWLGFAIALIVLDSIVAAIVIKSDWLIKRSAGSADVSSDD
jgi:Na+-driven multidrug efflux pump